jgi:hypothetical protein
MTDTAKSKQRIVTLSDAIVGVTRELADLEVEEPSIEDSCDAILGCHNDLAVAVDTEDWPEVKLQASRVAAWALLVLMELPGGFLPEPKFCVGDEVTIAIPPEPRAAVVGKYDASRDAPYWVKIPNHVHGGAWCVESVLRSRPGGE